MKCKIIYLQNIDITSLVIFFNSKEEYFRLIVKLKPEE